MSVRRMLSEMDSRELTEWMAFLAVKHERDEQAQQDAAFERRHGVGD
jgi:hypothetical protein